MEYKGEIEIKEGFTLTNPTMEVIGIFDALDENDNILFKYLEIHFQEPNELIKHSRSWEVGEGVNAEDFIASNNVLNKFK